MKRLKNYLFYALAIIVLLIVAFFYAIGFLFTIAKWLAVIGFIFLLIEITAYKLRKQAEKDVHR